MKWNLMIGVALMSLGALAQTTTNPGGGTYSSPSTTSPSTTLPTSPGGINQGTQRIDSPAGTTLGSPTSPTDSNSTIRRGGTQQRMEDINRPGTPSMNTSPNQGVPFGSPGATTPAGPSSPTAGSP